jgi:hypothetical protein
MQIPTQAMSNRLLQFALTQYNKAVACLNRRLGNGQDRSSSEVLLMTCILFVCLELLRGHYGTAILHLHNGRNILWDYLSYSRPGIHSSEEDEVEVLVLSEAASSTEDKLVEIFARLDIQSTNFGSSKPRFCLLTEKSASTAKGELRIPEAFGSLLEARQNLDALLNAISRFLGIAPDATVHRSGNAPAVSKRDALLTKLEQWAAAFSAYQATHHFPISTTPDPRAAQKSTLLLLHHTYLTLKLSTWFYSGFETKYDAYTPQFLTLITLAESMSSTGDKRGSGLPPFSLDTGTIQPLYYTILHCRVRALRRRALRVLAETPHREGTWDAAFLARVGRRIVELEEMGGGEKRAYWGGSEVLRG